MKESTEGSEFMDVFGEASGVARLDSGGEVTVAVRATGDRKIRIEYDVQIEDMVLTGEEKDAVLELGKYVIQEAVYRLNEQLPDDRKIRLSE